MYLGLINLEVSKTHLYKLYYDILQQFYGEDNLKIQFKDTDSYSCTP